MSTESLDRKYVVYKHTCPNGKVYIGITQQNPLTRWASGFGYQTQIYFWRAIVKYGWINIKHEILYEGLTEEAAKATEIQLIKEYNSQDINCGYNIMPGGDVHYAMEKEVKEKISKSKTGKKWSERRRVAALEYFEHYQGRTVYKYNKQGLLVETFKTAAAAARDAGLSVETLRSRLKNNKKQEKFEYYYSYGRFEDMGKPYENRKYTKAPVDMYDLSLNFIKGFESIAEAARYLDTDNKHISDVCKGKRLSCNGYIWRYHNEDTNNKAA